MSVIHVIGGEEAKNQRGILREIPDAIRIITPGSALCGYRAKYIFVHESAELHPQDDWVNSVLMLRLVPGGEIVWLGVRKDNVKIDKPFGIIPIPGFDAIKRSVELAQELGYDLNHNTTNYAPIIVEMLIELRDLRKEKAERNKRPALKISGWGDR